MQLSYKEEFPDSSPELGIVLTFHGYAQIGMQARPLAEPFKDDFRIVVLESPRPAMMYGRVNDGRSWYNHQGVIHMETGTFGDGLAQVEQFLLDTVRANMGEDGTYPKIFLVGVEQGAAMALSIATVWPEVVAGVVSVCGHVPEPAGWTPRAHPMQNMPVLMIHDPDHEEITEKVVRDSTSKLADLGAALEEHVVPGAQHLPDSVVEIIRGWKDKVVG